MGTKYPNPWSVLAASAVQIKVSFVHSIFLGAGACWRVLDSGMRGFTKGISGIKTMTTPTARIRSAMAMPYLEIRVGMVNGSITPPTDVPMRGRP